MRVRGYALLIVLPVALASLPAQAHKLKVFATAEGDRIEGEAYFAGGAKAAGVAVAITDGEGHELARLTPDAEGRFHYRVDRRREYRVVADSLDGHVASWTIRPEEFSSSLPQGDPAQTPPKVKVSAEPPSPAPQAQLPDLRERAALSGMIERAVARQVRPLREALLAYDDKVRLHDILGGIGYIAGIAGIGLWWRNRGGTARR